MHVATSDNQLLTTVARGTLITSRYWPSRNMSWLCALSCGGGARTRRVAEHPQGLLRLIATSRRLVSSSNLISPSELTSHADSLARRTLLAAPRNGNASQHFELHSHVKSHLFLCNRVFDGRNRPANDWISLVFSVLVRTNTYV